SFGVGGPTRGVMKRSTESQWTIPVRLALVALALAACGTPPMGGGGDASPDSPTPDGGPPPPPTTTCTPDPAQLAERRECRADDHCPCGAHCVLGECVADCGPGMPACANGQRCDMFGRCRAQNDTALVPTEATAAEAELRFEPTL